MTAAEHLAQRDAVRGSLLCDEQRQHRHDAPARRTQVVRGPNAQPTPNSVESHPRVQASGSEERGCDPCSPTPTVCGFCHGEPVTDAASWLDGQDRPPARCPRCGETNQPVARLIPGTPRIA